MSSFPTRRKFLQLGATGTLIGALAVVGDGTILAANQPQLVSIEVPLPRLPEAWDGFRIAQLADFHYDDYFSAIPLRKAVDMINPIQPDLVVLTGDFVTSPARELTRSIAIRSAKAIEPCALLLAQLQAPSGILAVLGNHDVVADSAHIIAVLQSHGISVLRNRCVPLERNGKRLWVSGVDDVLEGKADLALATRNIPPGEPVILLAHEPDWADYVAHHPVDLQLSGHSHGGQIRLPLIGPPYLPKLARKYPRGLRQIGPLTLYTNSGIGTIGVPMRLNCPPEVTLIVLRATGASGMLKGRMRAKVSAKLDLGIRRLIASPSAKRHEHDKAFAPYSMYF